MGTEIVLNRIEQGEKEKEKGKGGYFLWTMECRLLEPHLINREKISLRIYLFTT